MFRLTTLLAAFLLGGGLVYFTLQYHLVRGNDGFLVVPKQQAGFHDAYVDVRSWTPLDWQRHPVFVQDLILDGRAAMVPTSSGRSLLKDMLLPFESFRPTSAKRY